MKTLSELQADREHAIRTANDVVEKTKKDDDRPLTPDEKSLMTNLQSDIVRLEGEINERRIKDQCESTVTAQMESLTPCKPVAAPMDPVNDGEVPKPDVVPYHRRFGKLRAFRGPDAERKAFRSGKFMQAALFGDPKADRWCRHNGIDWRALSVGTNTAGGFLVPEDFGTTIIDLREEYGIFRQHCRVIPMTEHTMTIPRRAGGVTATYTGENTALTESDATFNQVTLVARKLGVLTRISSELSEDSIIDIADWCAQEFAYAFAQEEDDAGFKGDGSLTYGHIAGASIKIVDGTHTAGAVEATAGIDLFTEVTITEIEKLVMTLPLYAHRGAKWFMSPICWATCFERLALAAGGTSATHYTEGLQRSYLGFPVVLTFSLPNVSTSLDGATMFMFGDLSMAATLDRYFVEDQIAIKATQRYDINVHDLGDTSNAGPLVALYGNIA
jgi:HK97 family phage major capsid protein